MSKKLMFSDIKEFKKEEFFNTHKTGKLYTDNGIYDIKIYTVNVLDSNKDIAYRVEQYKNGKNNELIANFEKSAIYKNEIDINENDKFIMLTTCNGVGSSERAVLFCKLEKIETTSSINDENNSDIDRDEKIEEKEKFESQKKLESQKIKSELSRAEYKNVKNIDKYDNWSKLKYYLEQLLNDPRRLAIYICVFFTVIIYVVLIVKKIKHRKNGKNNKNKNNIYGKKDHIKNIDNRKNKNNIYNRKNIERSIYTKTEQRNKKRIEELRNMLTNDENINVVNKSKYNNKNSKYKRAKKEKGKHSK